MFPLCLDLTTCPKAPLGGLPPSSAADLVPTHLSPRGLAMATPRKNSALDRAALRAESGSEALWLRRSPDSSFLLGRVCPLSWCEASSDTNLVKTLSVPRPYFHKASLFIEPLLSVGWGWRGCGEGGQSCNCRVPPTHTPSVVSVRRKKATGMRFL